MLVEDVRAEVLFPLGPVRAMGTHELPLLAALVQLVLQQARAIRVTATAITRV